LISRLNARPQPKLTLVYADQSYDRNVAAGRYTLTLQAFGRNVRSDEARFVVHSDEKEMITFAGPLPKAILTPAD